MGAQGTARTPISCQFQLPQATPVTTELQGTGLWWPPIGVTSVISECIGAGGAGGSRTTVGLGGGGGGGEYAQRNAHCRGRNTCAVQLRNRWCDRGQPRDGHLYAAGTGNWTCPAGVTICQSRMLGRGSGRCARRRRSGGGSYGAESSLAVTAGKTYPLTVGLGGSGGGLTGTWATVSQRTGGKTTFAGDQRNRHRKRGHHRAARRDNRWRGRCGQREHDPLCAGNGGTAPSYGGGGGGGSGSSGGVGGRSRSAPSIISTSPWRA